MESIQIDGNDVEVVYTAVSEAAKRARAGAGPTFIEGLTYRLAGHMAGDLETYRTSEEIEMQRQYEPLHLLHQRLLDRGVAAAVLDQIRAAVETEVEEAVEFAQNAPGRSWLRRTPTCTRSMCGACCVVRVFTIVRFV